MTYRELIQELNSLSEDRLDDSVCVHMPDDDEYYQISTLVYAVEGECSLLNQGHPILATAL